MKILEYVRPDGSVPFAEWFDALDAVAASRVRLALARMEAGNFADTKGIGRGVQELRLHWGAGYRIYFGRDGGELVILLAGGTKRRQQSDIQMAQNHWADYKSRRREG